MLSLLIIFMLFGTLMPLMQKMQQTLHDKQMRMIAYETMHEAAKTIHAKGLSDGQRMVNGTLFAWEFETRLCVNYTDYREEQVTICEE